MNPSLPQGPRGGERREQLPKPRHGVVHRGAAGGADGGVLRRHAPRGAAAGELHGQLRGKHDHSRCNLGKERIEDAFVIYMYMSQMDTYTFIYICIYICIMMVMYCRTCIKNDFAWFLVWYNEYLMIIKAKLSIRLSWCHGRIYINPKGGDFVKQLGFDLARMQTSGGIEYNSYNRWAVAEGFSCLYSDYSRWGDSSRLCWPNNWGICRLRHRRSPKL